MPLPIGRRRNAISVTNSVVGGRMILPLWAEWGTELARPEIYTVKHGFYIRKYIDIDVSEYMSEGEQLLMRLKCNKFA